MMPSLQVPISIAAKTRQELSKKMLQVQAQEGGKVAIVAIYFDSEAKEHVCWYYALHSLGGAVF